MTGALIAIAIVISAVVVVFLWLELSDRKRHEQNLAALKQQIAGSSAHQSQASDRTDSPDRN